MSKVCRILVVDDHPIFRAGLAQFISRDPGLEVCGEAEDGRTALKLIKELEPDLVTLDLSMKDTSGTSLMKDIQSRHPALRVLVVSMHDESLYAERALRAGAKGYLNKQEADERVIDAIRRILEGGIYVSEEISGRVMSRMALGVEVVSEPVDLLSDRELEVFEMIGRGQGTRQIAEVLHLSVKTIENYRANVMQKLNLKGANALVVHAARWLQEQESGSGRLPKPD